MCVALLLRRLGSGAGCGEGTAAGGRELGRGGDKEQDGRGGKRAGRTELGGGRFGDEEERHREGKGREGKGGNRKGIRTGAAGCSSRCGPGGGELPEPGLRRLNHPWVAALGATTTPRAA